MSSNRKIISIDWTKFTCQTKNLSRYSTIPCFIPKPNLKSHSSNNDTDEAAMTTRQKKEGFGAEEPPQSKFSSTPPTDTNAFVPPPSTISPPPPPPPPHTDTNSSVSSPLDNTAPETSVSPVSIHFSSNDTEENQETTVEETRPNIKFATTKNQDSPDTGQEKSTHVQFSSSVDDKQKETSPLNSVSFDSAQSSISVEESTDHPEESQNSIKIGSNSTPKKEESNTNSIKFQTTSIVESDSNPLLRLAQEFERTLYAYDLQHHPAGKSLIDSFWDNDQLKSDIRSPKEPDTTWAKKQFAPFLDGVAFLLSQLLTEFHLEGKQNNTEAAQWLKHFLFEQVRDFAKQENLFIITETIPYSNIFDPQSHRAINAYNVPPDYIDMIIEVHKLGISSMNGEPITIPEVIVGK